jgi:hypothetical protein
MSDLSFLSKITNTSTDLTSSSIASRISGGKVDPVEFRNLFQSMALESMQSLISSTDDASEDGSSDHSTQDQNGITSLQQMMSVYEQLMASQVISDKSSTVGMQTNQVLAQNLYSKNGK